MKHEPHDFEAPTRQAKIKEWLGTMRGPGKVAPAAQPRAAYETAANANSLSLRDAGQLNQGNYQQEPFRQSSYAWNLGGASGGIITDDLGYRR